MTSINTIIVISLSSLLVACGGGGGGERTVPEAQPAGATFADIGNYVVHYNTLPTDQLSLVAARTYNIPRSKNRAMLNVSVIEKASNKAVTAVVTVKTRNLTGQLKNVTMRKIVEGQAIYYIGETPIANRETLVFDVSVTPDGADQTSEFGFQRQFYTD